MVSGIAIDIANIRFFCNISLFLRKKIMLFNIRCIGTGVDCHRRRCLYVNSFVYLCKSKNNLP